MQARGDGGLADQGEKQRWRERGEAVSGWHTVSVKGQNVSGVLGFVTIAFPQFCRCRAEAATDTVSMSEVWLGASET